MTRAALSLCVVLLISGCASEPTADEIVDQLLADYHADASDPSSELYAKRMARHELLVRPSRTAGPWDGRYAAWSAEGGLNAEAGAFDLEVRWTSEGDLQARITDRRGQRAEVVLQPAANAYAGTAHVNLDWPRTVGPEQHTGPWPAHHVRLDGELTLRFERPYELTPQDPALASGCDDEQGVLGIYMLTVIFPDGSEQSVGLERLPDEA